MNLPKKRAFGSIKFGCLKIEQIKKTCRKSEHMPFSRDKMRQRDFGFQNNPLNLIILANAKAAHWSKKKTLF